MNDSDKLGIIVIALCLVGSMFFSGGETAITSYEDRRAHRLVEEGGTSGRALKWWVDSPVGVLSAILLGNNIVNTLLGATATALTIRHIGQGEHAEYAVPVAVVFSTGLLLVFGEIVPKAVGRAYRHSLAVPILRVLHVFSRLTFPITWTLTRLTNMVVDRMTAEESGNSSSRVTSGELDYLIRVGQKEGSIRDEQASMLQGVFRIGDKHVRDIMVPLDRVTAVDLKWNIDRIKRVAKASGHSRLPVYARDIDNVRGVLHIKQIVGNAEDGNYPRIVDVMRQPLFVSESLLIQDLLRRFKEKRLHLAIVVDDAGDTVGVVTMEDVLEQIVGLIFDETDRTPVSTQSERVGVLYLDGQASLSRVEERFQIEFEEVEGVDSIGDLLTRLAGQMPISGSVFVWEGVRIKVLTADSRHVIRVSVETVELEDETED